MKSRERRNSSRRRSARTASAEPAGRADDSGSVPPSKILQRPFVATLIGIALYWAAFPPIGALHWAAFPAIGAAFLGWLAPVPWITLVSSRQLVGRRPYLAIWFAATLGWMAILQGVRLPFWALYFGWFVLSAYVAVYVPLFVALTRVAHHRWKVPVVIAAPIIWCGLESIRGRFPVSFAVALLGHTQVRFSRLIQIADIGGAVTVSALLMVVATAIATLVVKGQSAKGQSNIGPHSRAFAVVVACAALVLSVGYGEWRLRTAPQKDSLGKVALLQGTFNTVFEYDRDRNWETFDQYKGLAWKVSRENEDLTAIVWPESTLSGDNPELRVVEMPKKVPPGLSLTLDEIKEGLGRRQAEFVRRTQETTQLINSARLPQDGDRHIAMIGGTSTSIVKGEDHRTYNSALLIQPDGSITDRYYKNHLVLIGEYVPLADRIEWIRRVTPISLLHTGDGPQVFRVGEMALLPNICFESTVPQLLRQQLQTAEESDGRVDAIVNMTHDGWFWGSSILDLHMACGVFRAVENRLPYLAAANPGLTYACDGSGRIEHILPRMQKGSLVVDVRPDGRKSLYQVWADGPFFLCAAFCLAIAVGQIFRRRTGFQPV